MQLLGSYPSKLLAFHREELLNILQQAITAGEYGGGKLVNREVAELLNKQVSDFSTLPGIPPGTRALAESVIYPLRLLAGRYQTIVRERDLFLQRLQMYLDLLEKDSGLIDQLIAAANMETWVSRKGPLTGAVRFYQDFAATHGVVASDLPLTDPETGVLYTLPVQDVTYWSRLLPGMGAEPLRQGIAAPAEVAEIGPASMTWSYDSGKSVRVEDLSDADWAKLGLLESTPRVRYGSPVCQVILPPDGSIADTFEITGSEAHVDVPVFVKTTFEPRRQTRSIGTGGVGEPVQISPYRLLGDDLVVVDSARSYEQGIDYTVNSLGQLVPAAAAANRNLTVLCTELFPSYRCSTNQQAWSAPVFLDASGSLADGRFPIQDESGAQMGLWIRMLRTPRTDYLFRIDRQVFPDYGVSAVLEVELDRPSFINGFHLSPFSPYPAYLTRIESEGMTSDSHQVLYDGGALGEILLNRPMTLRFSRQIIGRVFLHLRQENYVFSEHVINPEDRLRRETLLTLQASLPFSERRMHVTPSQRVNGVQYEFGLRDLRGEDRKLDLPRSLGVMVLGPFEVSGVPELLRLDADFCGDVDFYILEKPYNLVGVQVASSFQQANQHGIKVTPGAVFGYVQPATEPDLSKVQFYVKCVLRDEAAVVERFLLSVTTV